MSYALQSQVQLSHDLARQSGMTMSSANTNSPEAIQAVAEEFESLFMNMMLKSMRSANRVLSEGNYLNSFESKMYEDMLDEKLSVSMSKHGSLGIADLLVKQLSNTNTDRGYDLKMTASDDKLFPGERRAAFASQQHFVETIEPAAQSIAKKLGVPTEYIVAQAALETGWGQHVMFDGDGSNSHNLFGIKARSEQAWSGRSLVIDSMEVQGGIAKPVKSTFKMYDSYEHALQDYGRLLQEPRYQSANHAASIEKFGTALQQAGYATDPEYAQKLARVHGSIEQLQLAEVSR
jgi:flagellar protein FlgJ